MTLVPPKPIVDDSFLRQYAKAIGEDWPLQYCEDATAEERWPELAAAIDRYDMHKEDRD